MLFVDPIECVLCAVESRLVELRQFGVQSLDAIGELLSTIASLVTRGRTPLFIESYDKLTGILGKDDPHLEEKRVLEELASSVIYQILKYVNDDLTRLVEIAAAANSVDVPMRDYRFDASMFVDQLLEEPIYVNVSKEEVRRLIENSKSVGYVVDNSGEFQIDMLFIKTLVQKGLKVVVYTRELPYEVDVTYKYVKEALKDVNVEVISTGNRYPAFYVKDLWQFMKQHDVIISKGVGNFEACLESGFKEAPVLFLLRVKCTPFSRFLGVAKGKPVIYLYKP